MVDGIRCRSGLNIVRDSEATCGSVPQYIFFLHIFFGILLYYFINVMIKTLYISNFIVVYAYILYIVYIIMI